MNLPTIVVVTYNRINSLTRVLHSLRSARYGHPTRLVISIDHSDSDVVEQFARSFEWGFGEKKIIVHQQRLGLKEHVLRSGDLVNEYGSIIMLEDDLIVSPEFYHYACSAIDFYDKDVAVNGISLYNHKTNFNTRFPFSPIEDGSDVYFLQFASSWGQAWTEKQWNNFREWHKNDDQIFNETNGLPDHVNSWPSSSWLKSYAKYLVLNKKYFVYPRISLSTNFGDSGTHLRIAESLFQVPLLFESKVFTFKELKDSLNVYDSHFELSSDVLKKMTPGLAGYNFCVSLNGTKTPNQIQEDCVLTTVPSKNVIQQFGLNLKPIEMNVAFQNQGYGIFLLSKEEYTQSYKKSYINHILFEFYYRMPKLKEIVFLLFVKVKRFISRRLL